MVLSGVRFTLAALSCHLLLNHISILLFVFFSTAVYKLHSSSTFLTSSSCFSYPFCFFLFHELLQSTNATVVYI